RRYRHGNRPGRRHASDVGRGRPDGQGGHHTPEEDTVLLYRVTDDFVFRPVRLRLLCELLPREPYALPGSVLVHVAPNGPPTHHRRRPDPLSTAPCPVVLLLEEVRDPKPAA